MVKWSPTKYLMIKKYTEMKTKNKRKNLQARIKAWEAIKNKQGFKKPGSLKK